MVDSTLSTININKGYLAMKDESKLTARQRADKKNTERRKALAMPRLPSGYLTEDESAIMETLYEAHRGANGLTAINKKQAVLDAAKHFCSTI